MRRLPGILLLTGATLIIIVGLLVSGLRLALPHLDKWRPALLEKISQYSSTPVDASKLTASWQNFGPALDIRDINIALDDGGAVDIKRVTLALDVWQSLLHLRWQFRDLTFYQLQMRTNTPLDTSGSGEDLETNRISDLFLRQFDHFDLRDSSISFLTLSGERAELNIPQLTWLNSSKRHRAEGLVNLSSLTGQHGMMQVRMDLRDDDRLLSNGMVWLQADDVDVKPWFGKWMQKNIELDSAQFSLEAWMNIRKGEVAGGDIWLKQGGAGWQGEDVNHQLSVDNFIAHVSRENGGWQLDVPTTNIAIDKKPWPKGALTLAWLPEQHVGGSDNKRSGELRVRASNIELAGLTALQPLAQKFTPDLVDIWNTLQPSGRLNTLALDIPLQTPEKTRFQGSWDGLAWKQWKLLPGVQHFSGTIAGSVEHGALSARMNKAVMPYENVFRAPLEISHGNATLEWRKNEHGWVLDGKDIDVSATAIRAKGDFRYLQPAAGEPWLGILAGINVSDAGQAWRYFPENLMGRHLVDYLSGAIKGGQTENATLVYGGNPHLFPYKHNEGQFQVQVPLRNATFAFQPGWPALQNFDIELDFINDSLWMKAPEVSLGDVKGSNLTAVIPDYLEEKLLIDADVHGPGNAVGPYFKQTPLKNALGTTLDELQLDGDVSARLHLDIPLDGQMTTATGDVVLNNNSLFIKPLDSTLKNLSGTFRFKNGDLDSGPMQAVWFNQPLNIDFTTRDQEKAFQVGVNLDGNWQPAKTGLLPDAFNDALKGNMDWKGKVGITLPHSGGTRYRVDVAADLKNVSSRLPSPADKTAGKPLPVAIAVDGDLRGFTLSGSAGATNRFNSRWLLNEKLTLDRGIWLSDSHKLPPLPDTSGMELNLPALDGASWLALLKQGAADKVSSSAAFPGRVTLQTPALTMGGQQWNDLRIISSPQENGTRIEARGREINAALMQNTNAPWQADITYLYFNPQTTQAPGSGNRTGGSPFGDTQSIDFSDWPDLQLRCAECWLFGQKYGRIGGDFAIQGDTLRLSGGVMDTGFSRLSADGEWVNKSGSVRTSLKGKLNGQKLDAAARFFGRSTPLRGSSFDIDYDLHWRAPPWQPDIQSLNGILHTRLGQGEVIDAGTHTGQLLRLISFDSLLRKLRLDFSDTFGDGFYYDSIRSTAWIKDGVLHTDDTLVDGLEADIAMKGHIDLVRRELSMEAVVAPAISATVGVAAAFVVNPIVGAAVFAASHALAPLWSKVSILRYHITGPVDKPQINEVLRQPRDTKSQ